MVHACTRRIRTGGHAQSAHTGGRNFDRRSSSIALNNASKPLTSPFVSLHLKGRTDGFVLKGGDATKGEMKTMWDGPRPDPKLACCVDKQHHYQPMRKKGAPILGTGGDNSNRAEGSFYEGYLASGVTSAATDAAIQANIVAVQYHTLAASV